MSTLMFSALDEQQRKQVAYLFADEHFGTDARAYLYELNKDGDVTGRMRKGMAKDEKRAAIRPQVNVTVKQEVNITEEMIQHARMNMDALAAFAARRIYQRQLEEVTP